MEAQPGSEDITPSRVNVAFGMSLLAVVLYVVAMALEGDDSDYGFLWPLAGLTGLAGAVTGWRSSRPKPTGKALAAVIMGGLVFAVILGWIVVALATGE